MIQELAGSESSSETGLNRPITEDDSLQISGRGGFSLPGHCFETIAEAPENIPKVNYLITLSNLKICAKIHRDKTRVSTIVSLVNPFPAAIIRTYLVTRH